MSSVTSGELIAFCLAFNRGDLGSTSFSFNFSTIEGLLADTNKPGIILDFFDSKIKNQLFKIFVSF